MHFYAYGLNTFLNRVMHILNSSFGRVIEDANIMSVFISLIVHSIRACATSFALFLGTLLTSMKKKALVPFILLSSYSPLPTPLSSLPI